MDRTLKIIISILVGLSLLLCAFIGGFVLSQSANSLRSKIGISRPGQSTQLQKDVEEIYKLMEKFGYSVPSEETATIGALNGILQSSGDIHSRYLPPEAFENYSEEMSGKYAGIGVSMSEKDETSYVVEVFKGSPAEKAGIQVGDYFYAVDGETSKNWTPTQLSNIVRGEPGSVVKLTMLRPYTGHEVPTEKNPLGKPYDVEIVREEIHYPNVRAELKEAKVGYIKISSFNQITTDEASKELADLEKQGAKAIILDLRNNPGGLVTEAIGITSLFVEDGEVVRLVSRTEGTEVYKVDKRTASKLPLVVLVNENSASASEIVAGAIQDHERGIVVGANTFGKGSVQTQYNLKNGGAVLLTTARYKTPHDREIDKVGVEPDVLSPMDFMNIMTEEEDTQLKDAIAEALKLAK